MLELFSLKSSIFFVVLKKETIKIIGHFKFNLKEKKNMDKQKVSRKEKFFEWNFIEIIEINLK